ncbi:histone deacetylase [Hyphomicrobium sp.]|uniref:histone deacetylase n=1 Tax=Hyphomicrobium sp. TaxID=82 RepID=UPI001D44EAEA|nr:histone deacetylase [Hyphomicrobium sp.]MBY0558901.1 histone deacetylase [Hyphomicrobium sp.]
MALWSEGRGLDEVVRKTDNTLNVLVVLLLVAFALAAASYYYGQMNPRVAPAAHSDAGHPSTATQPHP